MGYQRDIEGAVNKNKTASKKRKVKIVNSSYQPSKAELNEDMRVNASFDEAIDALVKPADIEFVKSP